MVSKNWRGECGSNPIESSSFPVMLRFLSSSSPIKLFGFYSSGLEAVDEKQQSSMAMRDVERKRVTSAEETCTDCSFTILWFPFLIPFKLPYPEPLYFPFLCQTSFECRIAEKLCMLINDFLKELMGFVFLFVELYQYLGTCMIYEFGRWLGFGIIPC
ncbi:hypothetical protein J1N35_040249 [Gossypium stocksii]|uniref:Uncharacterized protein n=1 Tax=Gossypium stocksii TaxID=47602 RepID=A0A9D3UDG5_9ROSI|nr:hypothetical protein J1N35_040249 [Gossypium stocksii]